MELDGPTCRTQPFQAEYASCAESQVRIGLTEQSYADSVSKLRMLRNTPITVFMSAVRGTSDWVVTSTGRTSRTTEGRCSRSVWPLVAPEKISVGKESPSSVPLSAGFALDAKSKTFAGIQMTQFQC